MYTNDNFEKRFGMNIYKFISIISELDINSDEYFKMKKIIEKPLTFGRKTGFYNKRLKLNK